MPEMNVLSKAAELTGNDRREQWGDPTESLRRIAGIWSQILNVKITPAQVALCMVGLKIARAAHNPDAYDSWVDIAGYAEIGWETRTV